MFFQPFDGYGRYIHDRKRYESPANKASAVLDHALQQQVAFLDSSYRLSVIARRLDPGFRGRSDSPYHDIWKLAEVGGDRQTWMWPRIVTDRHLRAHARYAWEGFKEKFPFTPGLIAKGLGESVAAVKAIRARGGEVVFVRPPSDIHLRINEEAQVPKAKGWNALLARTASVGVHNDDLPPQFRRLAMPEWSHLTRACATVFTDAYVRRLAELTPRIAIKADAPRRLSRADCVTSDGRPL